MNRSQCRAVCDSACFSLDLYPCFEPCVRVCRIPEVNLISAHQEGPPYSTWQTCLLSTSTATVAVRGALRVIVMVSAGLSLRLRQSCHRLRSERCVRSFPHLSCLPRASSKTKSVSPIAEPLLHTTGWRMEARQSRYLVRERRVLLCGVWRVLAVCAGSLTVGFRHAGEMDSLA